MVIVVVGLLHLIAGMLSATSGSIRVDNLELTKLSEQGRDRSDDRGGEFAPH